jgi:hypothetical protein
MVMRYAYRDSEGKLLRFGECAELPEGSGELTDEQFDGLLADYSKFTDPDPVATARRRIDDAYQGELDAAVAGYPEWERESWLRQESEARSVLMSRPWITAAAEARGVSTGDLIDKIKEKADAFTLLHGTATGKRQRLQDEITALGSNPTPEQLNAIDW